jgi:hypothetical protein
MCRLLVLAVLVAGVAAAFPVAALAAADDIPGSPLAFGQTVTATLDSATKPNDVYAINLTYGQEVELTVHNLPKHTGNYMTLLTPSSKSIFGEHEDLASASTYNDRQTGTILYVPAVTGTYYVRIRAGGVSDNYDLTAESTGFATGGPRAPDIFGVAMGIGATAGVLDSSTYPNTVYAVRLFAREEVSLTVHNEPHHTGNYMTLLTPSSKSIFGEHQDLASASTYNDRQTGHIAYTPAVDGTYFVRIRAGGHNDVFDLTVAGSAEMPLYPTSVYVRSSRSSVSRGGSVVISGSLSDQNLKVLAGKSVTIERSYNGKGWTTLQTVDAGSGRYSARVTLGRSAWLRASFAGDADYAGCTSRRLLVRVK